MSVYNCPHCGEKTFNPLSKMLCGSIKSAGKLCPKCGGRCVNGMASTIFHSLLGVVDIALLFYFYFFQEDCTIPMIITIVAYILIGYLADMFFFPLAKAIRLNERN